jgi:mono/diheme cytochrome c family protein
MIRLINLSLILVLMLAGVIAACQARSAVPEYDGATLYRGYCASCHGLEGRGDGPVAPAMNYVIQDLRTIQARNGGVFPRQMIKEIIDGGGMRAVHGTCDMPVWGWAFYLAESRIGEEKPKKFAAARISALADYLESIQITK